MPDTPTTVTIGSDSLSPDPLSLARGARVNWTNNSGTTVTLNLPAIFSPPGNPTINNGQTSQTYTVNSNATVGSHTYTISTPAAVPRSGTIDVT